MTFTWPRQRIKKDIKFVTSPGIKRVAMWLAEFAGDLREFQHTPKEAARVMQRPSVSGLGLLTKSSSFWKKCARGQGHFHRFQRQTLILDVCTQSRESTSCTVAMHGSSLDQVVFNNEALIGPSTGEGRVAWHRPGHVEQPRSTGDDEGSRQGGTGWDPACLNERSVFRHQTAGFRKIPGKETAADLGTELVGVSKTWKHLRL